MADASIIDIGGIQWNVKDTEARDKITDLENKMKLIESVTFKGTFSFDGKLKYLGEDDTHIFYNFWWEDVTRVASSNISRIDIYPTDTSIDYIVHINLGISQKNNSKITTGNIDPFNSGRVIYLLNATTERTFSISAMGILRRKK